MSQPSRLSLFVALVLFLTAIFNLAALPASAADLRSSGTRIVQAPKQPSAPAPRAAAPTLYTVVEFELPSPEPQPEPEPEPEVFAYDLFVPEADGLSLVNSFLLATAAMYVYAPLDFEGEDDEVEGHLSDTMDGFGLELIHYIDHTPTDTQGAVFANEDVVIVSFRGTTPGQDMWTDLSTALISAPKEWGNGALVHAGFYGAFESVIDEVKTHVEPQVSRGKTLWITGHSLGGALATLTATWFEVNGTPVEGVHTFGSPRVGNNFFAAGYAALGLDERSWRWIMEGDPIPAFVESSPHLSCNFIFCSTSTVTYRHVGIPNNIFRSGQSPDFDFDLEAEALVPIQASLCDGLFCLNSLSGAMVEHVKYDDAVDQFLAEEVSQDVMDVMPPVSLDTL